MRRSTQENTGKQIAPIQTPDELKDREVKDSNFQINTRTKNTDPSFPLADKFTLQGTAKILNSNTDTAIFHVNRDKESENAFWAMTFHTGKIGSLGKGGGGLGVLGLPNGVAFEMDPHTGGPEDNDPSFNHNQIKTKHAGFVSTSKSNNYLVALAPMQAINPSIGLLQKIAMDWDAANKKLTVDYLGKHWELINLPFNYTQKYNFIIAADTGKVSERNEFQIDSMTIRCKKPTVNEVTDKDTKVTGKEDAFVSY
ncbi:hypothetical protein FC683_10725 [Bacillus cereus]|uniref:lectin-like domain-containing protein n=1 Tax=Bacillus cereus TaxID=1396 RepID=UPI0010BD835A|nr:hypothetical protein [Bacillus cereus]TKI35483.1 hypothetical protein FC683_10725 [Bacillus cereus]